MGTPIVEELLTPMGYEQISAPAAATNLTVPAGTRYAEVQCLAQNVRWRDDGVAPTATAGMQLAVGDSMFYHGELGQIQFIEEAAGAEVNVSYYT